MPLAHPSSPYGFGRVFLASLQDANDGFASVYSHWSRYGQMPLMTRLVYTMDFHKVNEMFDSWLRRTVPMGVLHPEQLERDEFNMWNAYSALARQGEE